MSMGKLEVHQGSIYNPGWEVAEEVGERHWSVRATFDEKVDAEEFLAYCVAARLESGEEVSHA